MSLAIIGASDDPSKTTGRPLAYLRRSGWGGRIYPVNPSRDVVQGERAWPSLDALPEAPDHALILTGGERVEAAVEACARSGVAVASILATGFADAGPDGQTRQAKLLQTARSAGMRLLGPSSLGFADPRQGLFLTANAAFADPDLPPGRMFCASHSGSLIGALASRGAAKGLGFSGLVSVGVEADLSLGEICLAALEDDKTETFVLFLESLRHAHALRRFAEAAHSAGKPVVAYKLGRSAQAAELAQSHTGAMAGEDLVAEAFFRDTGISRVETLDALLEAPALVRRMPAAPRPRRVPSVAVVATTGGGAAMVADQLGIRGVAVNPPQDDTWARLEASGCTAARGRIVDLTMAGTRYEVMKAALEVLTTAPEFDVVVAVAGSSARLQPELAVQPILDSRDTPTPLAVFCTPEAPEALRRLAEAGLPAFRTPESCADAIAAALARREPRGLPRAPALAPGPDRALDEAEAYVRLAAVGVPAAPHAVLRAGGPTDVALTYPVVVKALSAALPHKTDAGGVVLGVADGAGLRDAVAAVVANVARSRPDIRLEHVLIQSMARPLGEALVGFRRDPEVGPVVLLAPGGILAEISAARSVRLAPVDRPTADAMIEDIPAFRALAGYRGRPKGDLAALAEAIVAVSRFADDASVVEAEINPLMVLGEGQGVLAVDALMIVREGEA